MTTEQTALQRMKRLCESATPGPWYHNDEMDYIYSETSGAVGTTADDGGAWTVHDIHAVIVMRNALPALIAYCEVLEECLKGDPLVYTYEAIAIESARARLESILTARQPKGGGEE